MGPAANVRDHPAGRAGAVTSRVARSGSWGVYRRCGAGSRPEEARERYGVNVGGAIPRNLRNGSGDARRRRRAEPESATAYRNVGADPWVGSWQLGEVDTRPRVGSHIVAVFPTHSGHPGLTGHPIAVLGGNAERRRGDAAKGSDQEEHGEEQAHG